MPYRLVPLVNGQIYHIFNRGSEKRRIFEDRRDYQRFLKTLQYYQLDGLNVSLSKFSSLHEYKMNTAKKLVEILAFCLMPNHFHLLVKQVGDSGITQFMSKTSNSFTKYYNIRHSRIGPLLQAEFKAVLIESDEQFIHVQRYIHLNPVASFLTDDLTNYEWSSYPEYLGKQGKGVCATHDVQSFFKSTKEFESFVLDQIGFAQSLELIKHKAFDLD